MLAECRTVTVGLDVPKSSVRLAAVSCGEVLRERTFAYDHDELLGEIAAWPRGACLSGGGADGVRAAPRAAWRRCRHSCAPPRGRGTPARLLRGTACATEHLPRARGAAPVRVPLRFAI